MNKDRMDFFKKVVNYFSSWENVVLVSENEETQFVEFSFTGKSPVPEIVSSLFNGPEFYFTPIMMLPSMYWGDISNTKNREELEVTIEIKQNKFALSCQPWT